MKITEMEIKELTISNGELEDIFTRWAQDMAAKLEQERIEDETLSQLEGATIPAIIDRSATVLLERCKEDPREVGKWLTKQFLQIVAASIKEEAELYD